MAAFAEATLLFSTAASGGKALKLERQQRCHICDAEGVVAHQHVQDRLFGVPGEWTYLRCPLCQSLWLDPRPILEDIHLAYRSYYTHTADSAQSTSAKAKALTALKNSYRRGLTSLYGELHVRRSKAGAVLGRWRFAREEAERLAMYLPGGPEGRRLLDIGCGNGDFLLRMAAAGWKAQGQEVDSAAVESARKNGCEVLEGELLSLHLTGETYDAITLQHTVEHVHDPTALLREVHRLLKPGGTAIVMTPNVLSWGHQHFQEDWRGLEPPRHIFLPSPGALAEIAGRAGFDSAEVETRGNRAWAFAIASSAIQQQGNRSTDEKAGTLASLRFHHAERRRLRTDPNAGEELILTARRALE